MNSCDAERSGVKNTSPKQKINLLVICGPTASGKTSLAVALAAHFGGEIISADSRQVYRGLDIGSGKDLHEYSTGKVAIPFHCIDIADPREIYTLFHYQYDFYSAFNEVLSRQAMPVLCGGTGLYIEAVLKGYRIPQVPEDRVLRDRLMRLTREELEAMLQSLDQEIFSATDRSSKKRVVRSIEVAQSSKNGHFTAADVPPQVIIRPLVLCTRWPRSVLTERIDKRLHLRFSQGMVDEVKSLRQSGVPDERLTMLGMEYKYITLYLRGELDYQSMVEKLRYAIHRLAKRQVTWFRGMERRGSTVHWIDEASLEKSQEVVNRYFRGDLPLR
jgi:tRNA dimethylallyltransferase